MNANIKPRFEIEKLKGTRLRRIAKPKADDKGKLLGGFEYEDIEHDAGWMVYLPTGASVHIWTQQEMERQSFLNSPTLIDMDSGETVAIPEVVSLKELAERTENTKSSRAAQS